LSVTIFDEKLAAKAIFCLTNVINDLTNHLLYSDDKK